MGDLPAAIRDFQQALALNPSDRQASMALAAAEAQLQNRR